MQRARIHRDNVRIRACFNPHPARRPDATPPAWVSVRPSWTSFNPHPARRPDATAVLARDMDESLPVSILIRPSEGRMQHLQTSGEQTRYVVSILIRPSGRMQRLYLNFLSVLREPPDTGLPICFHCPDHFFPPATIQLRTRTYKLQWLQHWVRVRPVVVP